MAESLEHATLVAGVLSSSPSLGVEFILKKEKKRLNRI